MTTMMKRLATDQSGKVLVLTLILLVLGSLIMTPLLGLMTAGLAAGQTYESKTSLLYAADAGVEQAIWHLLAGGSADDTLYLVVNGRDVVVEMEKLVQEACHEPAIYEIFSTASTESSSTTVMAHVTNIYVLVESGQLNQGQIIANDVFAAENLFLDSDAQIQGNAIVVGNLILNSCSLVGGVVCVGGDLTLNEGALIESDLYVGGNLLMMGGQTGSWVDGNVYVRGTVEMQGKSELRKVLWAGGNSVQVDANARVFGDVHVTSRGVVSAKPGVILGQIHEDYYDHGCPLTFDDPAIKLWLIL